MISHSNSFFTLWNLVFVLSLFELKKKKIVCSASPFQIDDDALVFQQTNE